MKSSKAKPRTPRLLTISKSRFCRLLVTPNRRWSCSQTTNLLTFWLTPKKCRLKSKNRTRSPPKLRNRLMRLVRLSVFVLSERQSCSSASSTWLKSMTCTSTLCNGSQICLELVSSNLISQMTHRLASKILTTSSPCPSIATSADLYSRDTSSFSRSFFAQRSCLETTRSTCRSGASSWLARKVSVK